VDKGRDAIEAAVVAQAVLLGLDIRDEHFAGTVENLRRIGALAKLVMEFPLPVDAEPAPVYAPTTRDG
jgi:hypothetical protein